MCSCSNALFFVEIVRGTQRQRSYPHYSPCVESKAPEKPVLPALIDY